MSGNRILPFVASISTGVGIYFGINLENYRLCKIAACGDKDFVDESETESRNWFQHVFPTVLAASTFSTSVTPSTEQFQHATNRFSQIMKFGYPGLDNVRTFENFVVSYDQRNRTAHWVFEHIKPEHLVKSDGIDRSKSYFDEDRSIHQYFRATNNDYKSSGYDRGHLAAAGNHRHSQNAMNQTFILSNVSPQVGKGFNRDVWNSLEKYIRGIARKNRNVYVCTGPLYLPRREDNGKLYVKYEVIGANHVAVPTHFFKVLLIENNQGKYDLLSYVLPNQVLPCDENIQKYLVPVEAIERAAGLLLFEKIPRKMLYSINGRKL